MKKKISFLIMAFLLFVLSNFSSVFANKLIVPNTDFTRSFSHSYEGDTICNYSVGLNVNSTGCCETKQYIQSPQYSFVAAQFTSLDGSISPESNSFSGGFTGYVSSGSACGSTQYAKKLMFYADVRNSQFEPLASWFRVYYE